jgi:hypothetical protein
MVSCHVSTAAASLFLALLWGCVQGAEPGRGNAVPEVISLEPDYDSENITVNWEAGPGKNSVNWDPSYYVTCQVSTDINPDDFSTDSPWDIDQEHAGEAVTLVVGKEYIDSMLYCFACRCVFCSSPSWKIWT